MSIFTSSCSAYFQQLIEIDFLTAGIGRKTGAHRPPRSSDDQWLLRNDRRSHFPSTRYDQSSKTWSTYANYLSCTTGLRCRIYELISLINTHFQGLILTKELLSAEIELLTQLRSVEDNYARPLRALGRLTPTEEESLFKGVRIILQASRDLCAKVSEILKLCHLVVIFLFL